MNNQDGLMSDEALGGETPIEDPAPPTEPVAEATEETGAQSEPTPEAPTYDYLEVDDPSSKYVKVKVDGEELDVPLSEALSGYQRQADYTRSKQALAEERKQAEEAMQVYQAMQANPGLTVQVLAQRAGVSVQEYLGMSPQERHDATQEQQEPEFDDPLERELYETRQQVAEMQRQMQDRVADERLARVVDGLREQYSATPDEIREAVQQTARMNLGIDAVPMVFRAMAYDKVRTQQQAVSDSETQRQQAEQQRQAAAAAAQQVVSSGQRSANGVTQAAPSQQPRTVREAIEMAFDEVEAARTRR